MQRWRRIGVYVYAESSPCKQSGRPYHRNTRTLEQNGVYICRESSRRELRRHPYHWNLFDKKGKLRKLVSELYKFKIGEYQL